MTTITAGAAPATGARAARGLAPGRDELIDAGALAVLTMIGIAGFRPAYGGHAYMAAGAAGLLLGLLLSHAGQRARLPLLAVVAASILAFLAFGGVISQTGTVSLPTLQAITGAAVSGWQQLLTTARPVGRTAGLLVLPFLLGMFSGVAGHALARRTATVLLPAAAPAIVVALSILFGAPQPTDAVLQGAGFTAAALAWAAVRQNRGTNRQATIGRQRPWQRIGAGAAVLAVAGAGATVIGPHLPGAGAHQRVVLAAVPPFDIDAYPSPLAGYRDYTTVAPPAISVFGKELMSTTLPAKTLVRIAAMDTYDGLSWGVANASAIGAFGGFQRVGTLLPGAPAGAVKTAAITTTGNYKLPWLPDVAGATGFSFGTADAQDAAALRYNTATATGIIPSGAGAAGLSYTVSYVPAPAPALNALGSASPGGTPDICAQYEPGCIWISSEIQQFANANSGAASTPMGKVLALAAYLLGHGRYSDGAGDQSSIVPGHGEGRLTTFLATSPITGDDEQYAATMALLANWVGVPARVSLDGVVQANGSVYGRDVHADVELDTSQYGWVTLPYSAFTPTKSPIIKQQTENAPPEPVKVVPPRHNQSAPVAAANSGNTVARTAAPAAGSGLVIPEIVLVLARDAGIPLLTLAALAAALAGLKVLRRRRRRALGSPAERVAGAWRELTDLGRDLGIALGGAAAPGGAVTPSAALSPGDADAAGSPDAPAPAAGRGVMTRREYAAYVESRGLREASAVAFAADAATFGPADPDGAAVTRVWQLVETARRGATAPLPRWRRAWVAVNPASLWASRAVIDRAVARARRTARRPDGARGARGARGQRRRGAMPGGAYR